MAEARLEDEQRVFLLRLESGRAARPLACRRRNKHKAVGKNQRNAQEPEAGETREIIHRREKQPKSARSAPPVLTGLVERHSAQRAA